mmetsp:Transcript_13077/g.19060  ORF Transcript_13077/g.19060 Transcript_13077/m.19060 type:complete len:121 (-) Transcript_13077:109-471(-)
MSIQYKNRFLKFIQILMKILKEENQHAYRLAKILIRRSAETNDAQDESTSKSQLKNLQGQSRQLVGETLWHKAVQYLHVYLVRKRNTLFMRLVHINAVHRQKNVEEERARRKKYNEMKMR